MIQLSHWGPPVVGNCLKLASLTDPNLYAFFFFFEHHLFDAIEKGKLVRGNWDWEWVIGDDNTAARIHSDSLRLDVEAADDGAELTLQIINDTDHDWPDIASIVPCFHAGSPKHPSIINRRLQDFERSHT